ncbi:6-phosphogluconate dehydrogenase [Mycobacterium talmoniae]|uniref:6-phosphogluconate dehydrogenase n=2 Tax=Mycobacterium talmoniae TaxID=1858794 RepID=A0A1S1NTD9_9MYCO|nr:6-phosphogluconate dehydrogenase [Mycobacterium talmoniae]
MVARLIEAGHQVRVLGRSAEKRDEIAELGAHPVSQLADVATGADVVVVCVFTDEQVAEVCLHGGLLAAMAPGSVLVVHTTASPRTIDAIAAAADHVEVVDAPVSGGPHDAAAGQLTLFVGGPDRALATVAPVLGCYGDPVCQVGPTGAGQRVKLVNNALFAAQIGLLSAASRLGERLGVAESTLLAALVHGSGASRVTGAVAGRGSVASFVEAVGDFVGKDIAVVRAIAADLGSDLGVLDDAINAASTA